MTLCGTPQQGSVVWILSDAALNALTEDTNPRGPIRDYRRTLATQNSGSKRTLADGMQKQPRCGG